MAAARKIVLHSVGGSRSELAAFVDAWIAEGVGYVGDETLEDAILLAEQISTVAGSVAVVEL